MASVADCVAETTTITGTGSVTLLGAMTGYRPFSSGFIAGDTPYYVIIAVDGNGNRTGQWESGQDSNYGGSTTLQRSTIFANSNNDTNPVNFGAGVKQVINAPITSFFSGIALFYTGNTNSNTVYPLGEVLAVFDDGSHAPLPNDSVSLFYDNGSGTGNTGFITTSSGTGKSALTGTWRSKGRLIPGQAAYIFQRVA